MITWDTFSKGKIPWLHCWYEICWDEDAIYGSCPLIVCIWSLVSMLCKCGLCQPHLSECGENWFCSYILINICQKITMSPSDCHCSICALRSSSIWSQGQMFFLCHENHLTCCWYVVRCPSDLHGRYKKTMQRKCFSFPQEGPILYRQHPAIYLWFAASEYWPSVWVCSGNGAGFGYEAIWNITLEQGCACVEMIQAHCVP